MQIPDPVNIGWPAKGSPRVIGTLEGHDLLGSYIPGHSVVYKTMDGPAEFSVGVSYIPDAPKRQELEVILTPIGILPEEIWECEGFEFTGQKPKERSRPTPRVENFIYYLERRRKERA